MFQKFLRLFNNPERNNQRILRNMDRLIDKINSLEKEYQGLTDQALSQKSVEFKALLAQGVPLNQLLVPAFATVREASHRVLGMRPFDVQLCGGIALHQGMIAEMKTGEGKTLVATLPVYLNALTGKGVHVITVNDYLAQRDSQTMAPLYEFLGLSVGCIVQDLSHYQRYQAYHADITYGTNNEFGFDYLKDNMKFNPNDMCQRGFAYAIVDEVDSILIDEARTPLIISGPADDASHLYDKVNEIIVQLRPNHYEIEEKTKTVAFTDEGYAHIEKITQNAGLVSGTDLFQSENLMLVHHLNQSLKAHKIFQKNIDYIIQNGKVVLIDEFTGRMMKGRRYSDGLHQAIEAKEHVNIEVENQTLASITFQNFFRMYEKLAGMTGTAETEAIEFYDIYKLPVLSIPTNIPVARKDLDDEIFRTFNQKLNVVLNQIKECHDRNQPVLVGTLSIEKSEIFADALEKLRIPFHVLNARHHEQEAKIIALAGAPGSITIATNMAGRGTDIKLGGNFEVMLANALMDVEDQTERDQIEIQVREQHKKQEEIVRQSGGLFVLGTERNENRRIDNQLRGRSGRQGDPGCSKFFISLEDDLMRIFGPNLKLLDYSLRKTDQSDSDPISHPWLTRTIEKAQRQVEAQHFDTRKHLLKYADVLNAQRVAVYNERHALMYSQSVHDRVMDIAQSVILDIVQEAVDPKKPSHLWNAAELNHEVHRIFDITIDCVDSDLTTPQSVRDKITQTLIEKQKYLEESWGLEMRIRMEKSLLLKTLDQVWIAHLNAMDHLRSGIHLQAYGQKDPLNEYRHEAFIMFKSMQKQWYRSFLTVYFHSNPMHLSQYEDEDLSIESLAYHGSMALPESDNDDAPNWSLESLLKQWSAQYGSVTHIGSPPTSNPRIESDAPVVDVEKEDEEFPDYRKMIERLLEQDGLEGLDGFWDQDDSIVAPSNPSHGAIPGSKRASEPSTARSAAKSTIKEVHKPIKNPMSKNRTAPETSVYADEILSPSAGPRRGKRAQDPMHSAAYGPKKEKEIKRRAPSKRGPYTPKTPTTDNGYIVSSSWDDASPRARTDSRIGTRDDRSSTEKTNSRDKSVKQTGLKHKSFQNRTPKRGAYIPKQAFNDTPSSGLALSASKGSYTRPRRESSGLSKKPIGSLADQFYASRAMGSHEKSRPWHEKPTAGQDAGSSRVRDGSKIGRGIGQGMARAMGSNPRPVPSKSFSPYGQTSDTVRENRSPSPRKSSRVYSDAPSDDGGLTQRPKSRTVSRSLSRTWGSKEPVADQKERTTMKKYAPKSSFSQSSDNRPSRGVSTKGAPESASRNSKPKKTNHD